MSDVFKVVREPSHYSGGGKVRGTDCFEDMFVQWFIDALEDCRDYIEGFKCWFERGEEHVCCQTKRGRTSEVKQG
jgi:hypothetical protein